MKKRSVLSIGTDVRAFDTSSQTYIRLKEYAKRCERFVAVVVSSQSKTYVEGNLTIHSAGGKNRIIQLWRALRYMRSVTDYDVATAQDPFEQGLVAYLATRRSGARLHIQCHTDPYAHEFRNSSILNTVRSYLAPYIVRRADAVRVVSKRAQQSIFANTGVESVVIPIVIPEKTGVQPYVSPYSKTLVAISRLEREKGIEYLLDGFALVAHEFQDTGLVIVGDGSLRHALEKRAQALGLGSRIVFVGNSDCVEAYLASATVFVQASAYEGYGLTLFEAARAHLPIVTTDVGLVGEVLIPNESCHVVERTPASIADGLRAVLSDSAYAHKLADAARDAVRKHSQTLDEYSDAIVAGFSSACRSYSSSLLVYCQAMDRSHPALGFFVDWIAELATYKTKITVVCLYHGDTRGLPEHVTVYSLGKEHGSRKITRIVRALVYAWKNRKTYSSVFVHMNEEYVLLCGWLWKLLGKPIVMWRNHHAGTLRTRFAISLCTRVLCTSKFSFTAGKPHTRYMPIGIDTDLFTRDERASRVKNSVLFLGRIDASKGVDTIVRALAICKQKGVELTLTIAGSPSDEHSTYPDTIRECIRTQDVEALVTWHGAVAHADAPELYRQAEYFVNASSSGMYDKTIFEAMACGCVVVASNKNLHGLYDDALVPQQGDAMQFAAALLHAHSFDAHRRQEIQDVGYELVQKNSKRALMASLAELI